MNEPEATPRSAEPTLLPHESDGIREYDNPSPGWWLWSLFGSIGFAIGYMFFYGMNFGGTVQDEYREDLIRKTAEVQDWYAKHPMTPPTDEALAAAIRDPAVIATGRDQFVKTCAPCHGEQAQGLIGPNLTDDHWLHGGKPTEIWTTIVKGVPAKGMPTWGRAFKADTLTALASFIVSIHGTNPAGAKAPEGELVPASVTTGAAVVPAAAPEATPAPTAPKMPEGGAR